MTKIKKLSTIFIGLLFVSLALHWVGKRDKTSRVDQSLFAVADTTLISGLTIQTSEEIFVEVRKEGDQWKLNDKYRVDPQLIYLLQRIIQSVETQRPVSRSNFEAIKSELQVSAHRVEITLSDGNSRSFYAGGNQAKTIAYFATEGFDEIYLVTIPGYKSYVSGIFELTSNQWRDRQLFGSTWRTLQQWVVDYSNEDLEDLTISFENKFLAVDGVNSLDTTALMDYLKPLEYFQVNDYLDSGSFLRYDSLLQVEPLGKITLKDIDRTKDQTLSVYPKIPGERFYLMTNQSNEMIVVDQKRMEALLEQPSAFRRQ